MPLQDLLDQRRELDPTATRLFGPSSAPTQLQGRTHGRSLCHNFHATESDSDRARLRLRAFRHPRFARAQGPTRWLLVIAAGFVLLSGCASKVGWSPTNDRICAPKDPAQVCSLAAPDYGHVIELGDTELLPGECAVLADVERGGLIRIETRDPQGERAQRWIRAPRSKVTILELREDGEPKVSERRSCDSTPFGLE